MRHAIQNSMNWSRLSHLYLADDKQIGATSRNVISLNERYHQILTKLDNARDNFAGGINLDGTLSRQTVINHLLPVLDSIDRAVIVEPRTDAPWFKTILLTQTLFAKTLSRFGIIPICMLGDLFDPSLHMKVGSEAQPGLENGAISTIVEQGYTMHGQLLRPAKVVVAKNSGSVIHEHFHSVN